MPNFSLYRGSTQATTKFPLYFWTWIWFLGIQFKESSPTLTKLVTWSNRNEDWKKANSLFQRLFRCRRRPRILRFLLFAWNLSTNINHKGLQRTANKYAEERRIYKDLISKNDNVDILNSAKRILQCWSYYVKINPARHQHDTERTQNRAGLRP